MNHILPAVSLVLLTALIGCGPASTDCSEDAKFEAFVDADGDGYGDGENVTRVCAISEGVSAIDGDCDDSRADIYPRAIEVCDQLDNDCDGDADEALSLYAWYLDADGDGIGDTNFQIIACAAPASYVAEKGDCDDDNALITPGRYELCDGIDNDCDGRIDDEDTNLDPESATPYWHDNDGDGFGNPDYFRPGCEQPEHTVTNHDDCDDQDKDVRPDAVEVCNNGVDDDCNGLADDDDPSLDLSTQSTWYADVDGDGYGDPAGILNTCTLPVGYVENSLDCDDADPQSPYRKLWIEDADGDGFGSGAPSGPSCAPPSPAGWIAYNANAPLDCDDTTTAIHPARNDVCGDGIDQDCSGVDAACIADSCAEAQNDTARTTGFHLLQGDLSSLSNDVSLSAGSLCSRSNTPGQEGIVKVKLQPGEVLTANLTGSEDMVMVLTTDCNSPDAYDYYGDWSNCLVGGDALNGTGLETLSYHNDSPSSVEAFLIVDCKSQCGQFQLDLDISPGGSWYVPANCGDALTEAPLTTGAYLIGGTLDPAKVDDINLPYANPCTGWDTAGWEVVVPVELQPGETVKLWYHQHFGDGAIYIMPDCNTPLSCTAGDDNTAAPGPEQAQHTNNTGGVQTVYLGLDCYWTDCSRYQAQINID